jgi:hypothetical protein
MSVDLDAVLKELNAAYPCRETQFAALSSVLGHSSLPSPSAICLTGLPATGKRTITRVFLEAMDIEHVWVDCAETISSALLFDRIVNGLRAIGTQDPSRIRMGSAINNFVVEAHKTLKDVQGKVVIVRLSYCIH